MSGAASAVRVAVDAAPSAAVHRRGGVGSRLLAAAEAEAWSRGCLGVYLDTFEYQALPFYRKRGYELFGTLERYQPGYRQYNLRKRRPD